jgi:hypothetical protein
MPDRSSHESAQLKAGETSNNLDQNDVVFERISIRDEAFTMRSRYKRSDR